MGIEIAKKTFDGKRKNKKNNKNKKKKKKENNLLKWLDIEIT